MTFEGVFEVFFLRAFGVHLGTEAGTLVELNAWGRHTWLVVVVLTD